jgi:hypothetical protein
MFPATAGGRSRRTAPSGSAFAAKFRAQNLRDHFLIASNPKKSRSSAFSSSRISLESALFMYFDALFLSVFVENAAEDFDHFLVAGMRLAIDNRFVLSLFAARDIGEMPLRQTELKRQSVRIC